MAALEQHVRESTIAQELNLLTPEWHLLNTKIAKVESARRREEDAAVIEGLVSLFHIILHF